MPALFLLRVGYGEPIHAVAHGTISGVIDRYQDQVVNHATGDERMSFPAGNSIVEDLGDGHFALYAHLKADSLKVKRGDRVKRGDVIAQMGNTGNSTGPHLHLHIMNSPRILESDGLPYVFDSFTILREVADMNALDDDMAVKKPAVVKDSKFAGKHAHRLMREGQIVQFSE